MYYRIIMCFDDVTKGINNHFGDIAKVISLFVIFPVFFCPYISFLKAVVL